MQFTVRPSLGRAVAGTQIILELAQAQTTQQSNHTEGAQKLAAPSIAGKNEVASLACHLGRRDKCTSRKPGQKQQQAH